MRKFLHIISILAVLSFLITDASAQNRRRRSDSGTAYGMRIEKKVEAPDSLELARRDSLHVADSLHRADSLDMLSKSSLDYPAFSTARDSIIEDFSNGQRLIYYYGDVTVTYQDMQLTAEYMEYDMKTGTVFAKGVYDSLEGTWVGQPVMTQGSKTYNMEEVRYNFNSGKARITNMITTEDDGILHGRNIKMMDDESINITKGKYTVCEADHPHYYLALTSAKVIRNPSQKTIFGPAYLVVEDVKLPFVGLPFGFIPDRPERATGLLMPTFGEEESRGFFVKDMGMYFVFGDYFDLSVTGDYYSLGSWALDINSRYKVNYKASGSFSITYSNDQTGEKGTDEFYQTRNFGVKWSHSQDSKAHPGMTFSASVDFSSPSNSRYNSTSISDALQNTTSSSISFSRSWDGFNLSINALANQNSRDSSYTVTFPNVTFSMSTIYPFKQKNRVGKEKFYEKISFGYNTTLQNKLSFQSSDVGQPGFWDNLKNGMVHNFTIGLPNFTLLRYISITPSVSYQQYWFFRKQEYAYNEETDSVEAQSSSMFNTLGITQNYSFSTSMSTRIYGTFNFGTHHRIQAIRHVITPSLSMSYTPNRTNRMNGWRTLEYTDASGNAMTYEYNIYNTGSNVYTPHSGAQATSLSFTLGNNLEAKVRDFSDTTGTGSKKVKLIEKLNITGSYNFMADTMKLSTISMSMSTTLFNKISINASAGFDPYAIDGRGQRYNKFAVTAGQGLLRLTSVSASASYSISGSGKIDGNDGSSGSSGSLYQRNYYHPVTGEFIPEGWLYYTNPNAPWSLSINGSFSYSKSYSYDSTLELLSRNDRFTATVNLAGSLQLSPRFSLNASGGYDFIAKSLSTTQLTATYDLHCFNISISWVPFGTWKSYSFRIAANASALADLLRFRKSSSYWDN